jgi:2-dehydro-3-deoxygluconokinase
MIELGQLDLDAGTARIGFAGDTLNTATYLARLGVAVAYVTNLGTDTFSDRMVAGWHAEGMDVSLVGRDQTRLPGIYAIETDAAGERSFRYWREASAARTLFSGVGATLEDLTAFDVIYLSGITLAILSAEMRAEVTAAMAGFRAAGKWVVFDTNYRPRLWADAAMARDSSAAMWAAASLALPSFDDEAALFPGSSPAEMTARIAGYGPDEVILKNGAKGPLIWMDGRLEPADFAAASCVVDTSGAGDSFNAGYLAARLGGAEPMAAAAAGHRLAATVIGHHGAVIPRDAMPR